MRVGISTFIVATALSIAACAGPRAVGDPAPPDDSPRTALLGPESFPCAPAGGEFGYQRYGVGRMRRGGLEREELEPDHVVIDGHAVNLHGVARVTEGATVEVELDEDYFAPTILRGPAGATVALELHNDGVRPHSFWVPGQGIDLHCGVRSRDRVEIRFPASGALVFTCRYGATSGMRGVLRSDR